MLIYKSLSATLKEVSEEGSGTAVIATLGVVDKDGDITESGAFGSGQVAKFLPAHDWMALPLGKATIREDGDRALADFQLNMKLTAAREWRDALLFDLQDGRQPIQEWSYGFTIEESTRETRDGETVRILKRLRVHEISPVVLGAGEGTRTLAVKGRGDKQRLVDHIHRVTQDVAEVTARANAARDMYRKEGRDLGAARMDDLKALDQAVGELREAGQKLVDLVSAPAPDQAAAASQFAAWQETQARLGTILRHCA